MKQRARSQRGYTAVELMLALGLFAVGVSGIIAMQKVTVVSNSHAKNLAVATQIAEAWLDQLASDATLWTSPGASSATSDIDKTTWVKEAAGSNNGKWFLPTFSTARKFGRDFDALGAPLNDPDNARFCTQVRLTNLYDASGNAGAGRTTLSGNALLRAEVRVFWLRDGQPGIAKACSSVQTINTVAAAKDQYHFVYKVTGLRQHSSLK